MTSNQNICLLLVRKIKMDEISTKNKLYYLSPQEEDSEIISDQDEKWKQIHIHSFYDSESMEFSQDILFQSYNYQNKQRTPVFNRLLSIEERKIRNQIEGKQMFQLEEQYLTEKRKLESLKQKHPSPERKKYLFQDDQDLSSSKEYFQQIESDSKHPEITKPSEVGLKEWNSTTQTILALLVSLDALTPTMVSIFLPFTMQECLDCIRSRTFWLKTNIEHKIQHFRANLSSIFTIQNTSLRELWLIYFKENVGQRSMSQDLKRKGKPILSIWSQETLNELD